MPTAPPPPSQSPSLPIPKRGDVWLADLNPVRGHEQAGMRPVLIVSVNEFNQSKATLVIVIPITSTIRNLPFHVAIAPPEGGLRNPSAALCEAVRSISKDRLEACWGAVSAHTLAEIEDKLKILMGL